MYRLVLLACAKNVQDGYVAPDDFNLAINQASRSYANYLLGTFQTYSPKRPFSTVDYSENQNARTRLVPLIKTATLTINGSGFATYPTDFLQVDAMWTNTGFNRISFVQQDALYSRYNSVIDPVQTNPIYLLEQTGFRFYPVTTATAKLSYVSNPPEIRWGYTLDANGIPVYNPGTSLPNYWDDASSLEVVVRALAIIGVELQLGVVSQYAQMIKTQGQ